MSKDEMIMVTLQTYNLAMSMATTEEQKLELIAGMKLNIEAIEKMDEEIEDIISGDYKKKGVRY